MTSRPPGRLVRSLSACLAFVVLLFAAIPIHAGDSPRQITVDSNTMPVEIDEGSQASNSGTYSLDSGDTFLRLSASVGDIVDNGGGSWSWTYTPPDDTDGSSVSVMVTLHVTDSVGNEQTVSQNFDLIVYNVAPDLDFSGITVPSASEGQSVEFPLGSLSDPGANTWTVSVDWGDSTAWGSPGSVSLGDLGTLSHTYAESGTYTVTVKVTDDRGSAHMPSYNVTVDNVAPVVTPPSNQNANEGTSTSFTLGTFTDDGLEASWSMSVDWGDMTSDGPTSVTPTDLGSLNHTYAESGLYTVYVTVTDFDGGTDTESFQVTVDNVAPTLSIAGNQKSDEGALEPKAVSGFLLGSFTDPGPDSPWTVSVTWGDGSSPDSFDTTDAVANIYYPHTYADNGIYTVSVQVTDKDGGSSSTETFDVTVDNVAPVLDLSGITVPSVAEGVSASFPLGSFSDVGVSDTWTVSVDWGDMTTPDGPNSVSAGDMGSLPHTYAASGTYTVTVTVTDKDSGTDSETYNVTVDNVIPVIDVSGLPSQTANEGENYSFSFGTFTDSGADTFTVSVDWGDSTMAAAPGYSGDSVSGYTIDSANHTYADDGNYTITVVVTDSDSASHTNTFQVAISNVGPDVDVSGVQGQTVNEGTGSSISLGTFTDPGADSWMMIVDWGDGSATETNSVAAVGSLGSLNHSYANNGSKTVTVTVIDDEGGTGSNTFDVTVDNVSPSVDLTGVSGQTFGEDYNATINLGTFTDPGADTWSGTVDWGDGTPADTLSFLSSGSPISAGHIYADNNTYTVTVTVDDGDGPSGFDTFQLTVTNIAPVLTIAGNQKSDEGSNTAKTVAGFELGTFTDVGVNDADWAVDVTWGDSGSDTFTALPGVPMNHEHTYADEGVYTVTVKVTDKDGGFTSDSFQITVDNVAPVVTAASNQTTQQDEDHDFDIGSFVDPGDDLFTVKVSWGDGSTNSVSYSGDPVGGYLINTSSHTYSRAGNFTVTVVVNDGLDSGTNTFQVAVSSPPRLEVEAPYGSHISSYDQAELGTMIVGVTNDVVFTIRNEGDNTLSGISVALDDDSGGEFELLTSPPTSLAPGAEAFFTVRCIPSVSGSMYGSLHINSNDPSDSYYPFDLLAEAVDETSDFLYVKVSGTTVDSGVVTLPVVWRGVTITTNQPFTVVYQLDNLTVTNGIPPIIGNGGIEGAGVVSVAIQFGNQKPVIITRTELVLNTVKIEAPNFSSGDDQILAISTSDEVLVGFAAGYPDHFFEAPTLIPPFGTPPEQLNIAATSYSELVFGLDDGGFTPPFGIAPMFTVPATSVQFSYSPFFLQGQVAWADDVAGDFLDGANWLGGSPPTSSQDAVFHDFGPDENPYFVSVPTDPGTLARSLQVLGGAFQVFGLSADSGVGSATFRGGESLVFNAFAQFVQEDDSLDQRFVFDSLTIGGKVFDPNPGPSDPPGAVAAFYAPLNVDGTNGLKILPGGTLIATNSFFYKISVAPEGNLSLSSFSVGSYVTSDGFMSVASGAFFGAVSNRGEINLDDDLGFNYISTVTFVGGDAKYVQSSTGKLVVDIEGLVRGVDYDAISGSPFFTGSPSAELDGTIELYGFGCGCSSGGTFSQGDEFVIMSGFHGGITGTFSTVNLPSNWTVEYRDTDSDVDGKIDAVVIVVGAPVGPQIGVLGPDGANLAYNSAFDFGGALVFGCVPVSRTFSITNRGTFELTVDDVYLAGPDSAYFFLDTSGLTNSLAPGESMSFTVEFKPDNTGSNYAYLVVESDDPDHDPFYVDFYGYGNGAAPVAANDSISRVSGRSVKVPASALLANDSDADSDDLSIVPGSTTSANGVTVRFEDGWVFYDATASTTNVTDSFAYTVTDGHDATALATVTVTVTPPPVLPPTQNLVSAAAAHPETNNKDITVTFQGVPRRNYRVWAKSHLPDSWTLLNGGAPVLSGNNGRFTIFDPNVFDSSTRYYRSEIVP